MKTEDHYSVSMTHTMIKIHGNKVIEVIMSWVMLGLNRILGSFFRLRFNLKNGFFKFLPKLDLSVLNFYIIII